STRCALQSHSSHKLDRLLSGRRLFGSCERVLDRKKQVEVHALLHVVVPGAARYAKRSSFGLRHHFAFNLALESVLRVRRIAHAGIDRSAQGNNCYEPLLHSSTRFHGFSVNNFSLYPFRGERFFPAILRSEPRCEPSYCSFLVT